MKKSIIVLGIMAVCSTLFAACNNDDDKRCDDLLKERNKSNADYANHTITHDQYVADTTSQHNRAVAYGCIPN